MTISTISDRIFSTLLTFGLAILCTGFAKASEESKISSDTSTAEELIQLSQEVRQLRAIVLEFMTARVREGANRSCTTLSTDSSEYDLEYDAGTELTQLISELAESNGITVEFRFRDLPLLPATISTTCPLPNGRCSSRGQVFRQLLVENGLSCADKERTQDTVVIVRNTRRQFGDMVTVCQDVFDSYLLRDVINNKAAEYDAMISYHGDDKNSRVAVVLAHDARSATPVLAHIRTLTDGLCK